MAYKVFISATSVEFKGLRERLADRIDENPTFSSEFAEESEEPLPVEESENFFPVKAVEQRQLKGAVETTLVKLSHQIDNCNAVVHVLGKYGGSHEGDSRTRKDGLPNYDSIMALHPDLAKVLNLEEDFLRKLTYTQWEAWLAIYYGRPLVLVAPTRKFVGLKEDAAARPRWRQFLSPRLRRSMRQQRQHIRFLEKRRALRPAMMFDSYDDLETQVSKKIIQILDVDLSQFHYPERSESIMAKMIEVGVISVYIVSSPQGAGFCHDLADGMMAYRHNSKRGGPIFKATVSQAENLRPENMEERYEDSSLFLFHLRDIDEHVRAVLDFAISHQFTFDKRRVRVVGIMDGSRRDTPLSDMDLVKPAGSPADPDAYEFDVANVQFIEEGKFQQFCKIVHRSFHPNLTMFSKAADFDDPDKVVVFNNAMAMYRFLIPDENERDEPENIKSWIGDFGKTRREWFDFLVVAHYPAGDPFAALWCNIDFREGLGHVPFWGARARHRAHGTAIAVAGHALTVAGELMAAQRKGSSIRAMIFEAEPVDLGFMREVIAEACRKLDPPAGFPDSYAKANGALELDLLKKITRKGEGPQRALCLLEETILEIAKDEKRGKLFDEELRRYRRLQMYADNPGAADRVATAYKFQIYGFYQRSSADDGDELSVYWQPPIVIPDGKHEVDENDGCFFHLFLLTNLTKMSDPKEIPNISARRVVDWEYQHFLGEQFSDGVPTTGLKGWDACLARNVARRNAFADHAKLGPVKLGPQFAVAEKILATLIVWPSHREDWKIIDPISGKL